MSSWHVVGAVCCVLFKSLRTVFRHRRTLTFYSKGNVIVTLVCLFHGANCDFVLLIVLWTYWMNVSVTKYDNNSIFKI